MEQRGLKRRCHLRVIYQRSSWNIDKGGGEEIDWKEEKERGWWKEKGGGLEGGRWMESFAETPLRIRENWCRLSGKKEKLFLFFGRFKRNCRVNLPLADFALCSQRELCCNTRLLGPFLGVLSPFWIFTAWSSSWLRRERERVCVYTAKGKSFTSY